MLVNKCYMFIQVLPLNSISTVLLTWFLIPWWLTLIPKNVITSFQCLEKYFLCTLMWTCKSAVFSNICRLNTNKLLRTRHTSHYVEWYNKKPAEGANFNTLLERIRRTWIFFLTCHNWIHPHFVALRTPPWPHSCCLHNWKCWYSCHFV